MVMLINEEIVMAVPLLNVLNVQERKKKIKQKTSQQRYSNWQRNQNKRRVDQQLNDTLPIFTSHKPYQVFFINYMSSFFTILRLIECARQTTYFTIDTENDDRSHRPALIQIELVQFEEQTATATTTTVVIFEMCHLLSRKTLKYQRIQQLLSTIFNPSKTFLTWGDGENELSKFKIYQLFQSIPVASLQFKNVQNLFKNWYNNTYKHNFNCCMTAFNDIDDDPYCTCAHRPYKDPSNTWSLQKAVAMIFQQFLDKSLTRNNWGQGLDNRLYHKIQFDGINYNVTSILTREQEQIRLQLVKYAVHDCLAVTKLVLKIGRDHLFKHQ
ncbi:unnamed protein product [Adineta steineri]|uniref:Uncharacterized protein n=2 Tax=Adineta steineri TaxID=433720 RepID=A0A819RYD2_9BILA|nr:unnamed protein product [Adineta steineri]